jgi:hypothetical protein
MAVDAQWAYVAAMLPLSADFSDARGNVSFFGTNSSIADTVGICRGRIPPWDTV